MWRWRVAVQALRPIMWLTSQRYLWLTTLPLPSSCFSGVDVDLDLLSREARLQQFEDDSSPVRFPILKCKPRNHISFCLGFPVGFERVFIVHTLWSIVTGSSRLPIIVCFGLGFSFEERDRMVLAFGTIGHSFRTVYHPSIDVLVILQEEINSIAVSSELWLISEVILSRVEAKISANGVHTWSIPLLRLTVLTIS